MEEERAVSGSMEMMEVHRSDYCLFTLIILFVDNIVVRLGPVGG